MASEPPSGNGAVPAIPVESSTSTCPGAPPKQKLTMSNPLRELLAEILHANLGTWHMALGAMGARGKGEQTTKLCEFLNQHEHDLLRGKTTTTQTLSGSINDLKKIAENEHIRRTEIETKGRGAVETESIPKHVTLWYDLMQDYEEQYGKKAAEKAKTNSRYALPDHIRALGIEIQKSDTAFLPGTVPRKTNKLVMKRGTLHWGESRKRQQRSELCRKLLPPREVPVPAVSILVAPRNTFVPRGLGMQRQWQLRWPVVAPVAASDDRGPPLPPPPLLLPPASLPARLNAPACALLVRPAPSQLSLRIGGLDYHSV